MSALSWPMPTYTQRYSPVDQFLYVSTSTVRSALEPLTIVVDASRTTVSAEPSSTPGMSVPACSPAKSKMNPRPALPVTWPSPTWRPKMLTWSSGRATPLTLVDVRVERGVFVDVEVPASRCR